MPCQLLFHKHACLFWSCSSPGCEYCALYLRFVPALLRRFIVSLKSYLALLAGLHGSFTNTYLGPEPGTEMQPRQHDIRTGVSRQGQPLYS